MPHARLLRGADSVRPATTWRGHVGAILILLSTGVIVALLNRYLWDYYYEKRRNKVIPRLLRDNRRARPLSHLLLLVLSIGYHAETQLKVACGSGSAAIILGFAAQISSAAFLAGMSLQIGPPYKLGDWLKIGDQFGEWSRLTGFDQLRTNDGIKT